jgi:hypothetical protein
MPTPLGLLKGGEDEFGTLVAAQWPSRRPATGAGALALALLVHAAREAGLLGSSPSAVRPAQRADARAYLSGATDQSEPVPLTVACQLAGLNAGPRDASGAPAPRGRAMIRPGDYEDRALFVDHDGVWRQKRGASDGVIEPVPEPWLERFLLRWFPHLALRRRQAQAELARLAAHLEQPPTAVQVQSWNHAARRWDAPTWLPSSPWLGGRRPLSV